MMAEGLVVTPTLLPFVDSTLVGYVTLRPVMRGQDAVVAVAEMANLAAAADADEIVVVWETQDIAVACGHAPLYAEPALNMLWATRSDYAVQRYPYQECSLRGRTARGLIPVYPDWLPTPPALPNSHLEPAIQAIVELYWKPMESAGEANMVESAVAYLQSQGFGANLVR